jgi:hypothetical protein
VEGEAGRGWAESGAGPEFKKKFVSNFDCFYNLGELWKIVPGDLGLILTWGFFLKSSRLSKYFRKIKYAVS